MRRILVEGARHRARLKRGGGLSRQEMEVTQLVARAPDKEILEIDQALTRFAQEQPQKAALVELAIFRWVLNVRSRLDSRHIHCDRGAALAVGTSTACEIRTRAK